MSESASEDERPSRRQRGWSKLKGKLETLTKKQPAGLSSDAEKDIDDFLRPVMTSADRLTQPAPLPTQASSRMHAMPPKLDINAAKPFAKGSVQARSNVPQDHYNEMSKWVPTKPTRRRGLTVGFVAQQPDVIGHGGDETADPPAMISRSKSAPSMHIKAARGPFNVDSPQLPRRPPGQPVRDQSHYSPGPMRRVQTGLSSGSAAMREPISSMRNPAEPVQPAENSYTALQGDMTLSKTNIAGRSELSIPPTSSGVPSRPADDKRRSLRHMRADEGLVFRQRRPSPSPNAVNRNQLETQGVTIVDTTTSLRAPAHVSGSSRSGSPRSLHSQQSNSPDSSGNRFERHSHELANRYHALNVDDLRFNNRPFMAQITSSSKSAAMSTSERHRSPPRIPPIPLQPGSAPIQQSPHVPHDTPPLRSVSPPPQAPQPKAPISHSLPTRHPPQSSTAQATQSSTQHQTPSDKDLAFQHFTTSISPAVHIIATHHAASARSPTPPELLRCAYWHFLAGRTGLENLARRSTIPNHTNPDPLGTNTANQTAVHHISLAKAWFVITHILAGHPETLAQRTHLVDALRQLSGSMSRHEVMPREESMLALLSPQHHPQPHAESQALKTSPDVWEDTPTLAPDITFVLSGGHGVLRSDLGMPLSTVGSEVLLRCFVKVSVLDAEETYVSAPIDVLMTVVRDARNVQGQRSAMQDDWLTENSGKGSQEQARGTAEPLMMMRSQTPLVTVNVAPVGDRGVTWEHVSLQEGWVRVKLPKKLRIRIDMDDEAMQRLAGLITAWVM